MLNFPVITNTKIGNIWYNGDMFEKTYSEDKSFKPETQKKALENWSGKKLEEKINDLPELFEKLEENPELFSNFATLLKNSFKQEDFEFKFSHYLRPDIFRKSIEQIVSDKFKSFHRTGVPASFRFAWNREKLETQKREELIDCYVLAKNFKSQAGPNQKFIKDANHQPKFKKEVAAQAASDYIEFLDYLPELTQRTPDKYGILKRNWLFKIYGFVIDRANSIISQGNLSEEEARGISDDLIDKLSKMLKENKAFSQDHLFNFLGKTTNLIENLRKLSKDEYVTEKILSMARHKDKDVRTVASRILYRLELGQVGISERGVKYLTKLYDLGEYNRVDYFARRLTASGNIGVFNEKRNLEKYFNLGDLSRREKIIRPEILDLAYETLFFQKENLTEDETEKRKNYLQDFQKNYFDFFKSDFFKETGIKLNNLDFQEQGWYLIYCQKSTETDKKRLKDFAKRYGESGLKTFLALEFGEENGNKILNMGERLEPRSASAIFEKFNDIVRNSGNLREELARFFVKDTEISEIEANKISEQLISKAQKSLAYFSEKMSLPEKPDYYAITEELNSIKEDIIFFTSVFKALIQSQNKLDFEEIKNLSFNIKLPHQIKSKEQSEMKKILLQNYSDNEQVGEIAGKSLEKGFLSENARFYILKRNEKIIAFNRFEESQAIYFGSFNVDSEYQNSAIGEKMLEESLEKESQKGKEIFAHAVPDACITSKYIEDCGFVIEAVRKYDNGAELLEIKRNDKKNGSYNYRKNISQSEIMSEYEKEFAGKNIRSDGKNFIVKFNMEEKRDNFLKMAEKILDNYNYAISRYFPEKKGSKIYYACFEPKLN